MLITVCKSKIHRATVTDCNLDYVGSITIDRDLMDRANLIEWEKVAVANIANGERFETYVIEGKRGSGEIVVNGAAAKLVDKGDLVIILAFGHLHPDEIQGFEPRVVHVDAQNRPDHN